MRKVYVITELEVLETLQYRYAKEIQLIWFGNVNMIAEEKLQQTFFTV